MNKRKPIKTTKSEIVGYWISRVDESELSVDFAEAHERCWRCAYKAILHRCHIIPHSLGGTDEPNNLVLLCKRCHIEAPNIANADFFWDWLKAQKVYFYDTYWIIRGMREYEYIYKEKIDHALLRLDMAIEDITDYLRSQQRFVAVHFGEGRINPSTIAGLIRNLIKEKERKY